MAKVTRTKQQVLDELLDELLEDCKKPEDLLGESGMLKQLTKGMVDRLLEAEMSDHLGYEKNDPSGKNTGNSRNGRSSKTIQTGQGPVPIEVPRDRNGEFEPQLIQKGQRRFKAFDDKIISLYARGMTTREIQGHLRDLYGSEVSPDLISRVTDSVLEEVTSWQSRPLDGLYPIVYLDAIFLKIRDNGTVQNKAVHLALGINMQGEKELLGLWIAQNECAHGTQESRPEGHPDRLRRRPDGLSGSGRSRLPGDPGATVHRPQSPAQSHVCNLERPQGCGCRSQNHLQGSYGR